MKIFLPLRPPVYSSIDENYQASLIYTLAWAWIICLTVLIGIIMFLLPHFWMRGAVIIGTINICGIFCLIMNRRKHFRLASICLSSTLWIMATLLSLTAGGIHAPAIVAYLPIIATVGYLFGSRAGIWMAILCISSALLFVILEINGALPQNIIHHTPLTIWLSYSISGLQMAVLQYLASAHIRSSYNRLAKEIEERKQSEIKLKESEFNTQMVMNNKILGIGWSSPEGKLLNANATFFKMLGYTENELLGKYFGDFTHPDDMIREEVLFDKINNKEIDNYTIEKRYKRKNGEYFWVELNLTAYHNKFTDHVDFFVGIIQNIQERKLAQDALKESEERYRTLVDNAVEALVVLDLEKGTFVSLSESAIQLFKMPREELMKKGPLDVSPLYQPNGQSSSDMSMEKINEAIAGGKPVFEWTHSDVDGNPIPCEARLVRLPSANRILVRGSLIDITDRKKAEQELKSSNERLRQLSAHLQTVREEERTNIAREIHDELGQLLTGLKMDASWIAKKINHSDDATQEKIESMFSLIDETIKTIHKISSDLRPGLLDDLGLQAALEWLCSEFEKRTGIRCRLHIQLNDYEFDKDTATGVFRVYQEALTNITRHAAATEVDSTCEINDGYLMLNIKDDGVGFNTSEAENKNTFGLLGMEERAHMLHGELKITSEKGKGSTIFLKVPLTRVTEKIPA